MIGRLFAVVARSASNRERVKCPLEGVRALVMPLAGTFKYFAIVPAKFMEERSCRWHVQLFEAVDHIGEELHDSRLTGLSPRLEITDGGPTPNPSSSRPAVFRSRFTLTASARKNSSISSAAFYVDRDLTRSFEPGDRLHMARTGCCGLGISLLRNDHLIFATGAISSVPLGNEVRGEIPLDLVQEAEATFKRRDPNFRFRELPVQISVDGNPQIIFRGRQRLGNYDIWVEHGFLPGIPGVNECAAISLNGACGSMPASTSAQLLDGGELEMIHW